MSKRVTIMMDDDIDKKLRIKQAKGIIHLGKNYSFSHCINDVLRAGLRAER